MNKLNLPKHRILDIQNQYEELAREGFKVKGRSILFTEYVAAEPADLVYKIIPNFKNRDADSKRLRDKYRDLGMKTTANKDEEYFTLFTDSSTNIDFTELDDLQMDFLKFQKEELRKSLITSFVTVLVMSVLSYQRMQVQEYNLFEEEPVITATLAIIYALISLGHFFAYRKVNLQLEDFHSYDTSGMTDFESLFSKLELVAIVIFVIQLIRLV